MRELAMAGVWLVVSAGLFMIEPEMNGAYLPYVAHGKWIALLLAGMNALRPVVKWLGLRLLRRLGWISPLPDSTVAPPKPVVHPEFHITNDRDPDPSPESIRP